MRMKQSKKSLSFVFCMMLIMAVALFTSGCNGKTTDSSAESKQETDLGTVDSAVESENVQKTDEKEAEEQMEVTVLGEGETQFYLR